MPLTTVRVLVCRLLDLVFRSRRDARLSEEIGAHLDELAETFVGTGMTPADARAAARRTFGGVDRVTQAYREQRGLPLFDSIAQDLRFAVRLLARERWFTATVVGVLALGIGSATAVFTIVNGMNLSELPVEEPDRVLYLQTQDTRTGRQGGVSFLDFVDTQRTARTFDGLAAFAGANVNVGDERQAADRFAGTYLSSNGFGVLRVHPVVGRDFTPADDRPGAEPVAILAFAVWRDRYGLNPAIVGRTIRVNGVATTVVGVMADGFRFPVMADLWQPLALAPGLAKERRDGRTLSVYGRLADRVTLADARAELASLAAALAQQFPATNRDVGLSALPFTLRFSGRLTEAPPLLMIGAVTFVLLIACANAASLLLARSAHRTREVALRAAMGAARGRIVRQLLVESVILAFIAGLLGLLLSFAGVRLFTTETADFNLPYWMTFGLDARVFAFLGIVCLGTGMTFGLAPAWQLARVDAHEVLKDGGRGAVGSVHRRRWMSGLLVAEVALTLTLLVGAGLLLRSGTVLSDADLVVDTTNVLTARVSPPPGTFSTADDYRRFYAAIEERLSTNVEVQSAAIASALPFVGTPSRPIAIDGEASPVERPRLVPALAVGDRFFEVLGLPVVRGRAFGGGDADAAQPAAIVNELFVSQYLGDGNPIGRRIRLSDGADQPRGRWLTVVGVSRTVRHNQNGDAGPAVYFPLALQPPPTAALIARGRSGRVALASILRNTLRTIDTDVALYNIAPLERISQQSRWIPRAMGTTLSLVAAIAFALATIGLYGVTAYGVVQRTAEIGIRIALGAERWHVLWLSVRGMLPQLAAGLAIGLVGAAAVGQLLRGFLVQISPLDLTTFALTLAGLIAAALAACVIPARWAVALDPVAALRHD